MNSDGLGQLFAAAEQRVIKEIAATDLTKRLRKESLLRQIQDILVGLEKPTTKYLFGQNEKEYAKGTQSTSKLLKTVPATFALIDASAAAFILRSAYEIAGEASDEIKALLSNAYVNTQTLINAMTLQVRQELLGEITQGQILGIARKEISRRVVAIMEEKGITAYKTITKNGVEVEYSLQKTSEAIVRSSLIQSRANAVMKRSLDGGHDLVKVDTHSDPSPMCQPWGGKILSITGRTPGYPTVSEATFKGEYKRGGGLFHRYCRHSLTVYIQTDIEFQ
jgi:hypothetical protein